MSRAPSDSEFAAFVHAVWPRLYRTAYLILGDHALAEDLVQTALAKTYASWHRIREESAAFGYARTTVIHTAGAWFRRKSWRNELVTYRLPERAYDEDPADRPDVIAALRHLPPRQRAMIVLRFYEDQSVAQTAESLGCSVGTVKCQTSDALARLRTLLGATVLPHTEGVQ